MSGLNVNISKLSEGSHHYSLSTEPADIGLDERFRSLVQVEVKAEKANRQLLVQVDSHCSGSFICDRCLDEFQREIKSEYSVVYVQGESPPAELEGKEEDIQYLSPEANTIDLGEDVRQYMVLSLPLKMLCKEDCAGLCPVCGINRNKATCSCTVKEIDPRWAGLKKFLNN